VTLSDGGRIKSMVSMPLGAVRLQQEFLQTILRRRKMWRG
jgi:exopolyphosphatase/guanosine-5'-triphosphate,3'-diphosphate pyrophosphatase